LIKVLIRFLKKSIWHHLKIVGLLTAATSQCCKQNSKKLPLFGFFHSEKNVTYPMVCSINKSEENVKKNDQV
ncbi:MAG: hypothetical protein ACI9YE_003730, partial [Psychroserpens sp.]